VRAIGAPLPSALTLIGLVQASTLYINSIFYSYVLIFIYASYLSPADYFPAALSTETWLAIYEIPILVINIEDLELDDDNEYNLLRTRKPRGRPKKRKEKQNYI
jgi:Sec-independent protein secretion pathway component TatC